MIQRALTFKCFRNLVSVSTKLKYKSVYYMPTLSTFRNMSSKPVDLEFSFHSPAGVLPSSETPIIILHGLLGSRMNWRSIANIIASKYQKQVYTLDARNHGDSPCSEIHDYPSLSMDVCEFMRKRDLQKAIIIGHSMGGRTAMTISLTQPHLVKQLIVVDVSPIGMPKSSIIIQTYFSAMQEVIKTVPSHLSLSEARQILLDLMAPLVPELSIRQFLLTNLASSNGGFKWKANVDILAKLFTTSIMVCDSLAGQYNGETLFVCGGDSGYVRHEDHEYIKTFFPKATFVYIPGAGHWIHSEKPQEFLEALGPFLGRKNPPKLNDLPA